MACFVCILWEVHQEHVSDDSNNACEKAFDDKYPLPGLQATQATHLRDAVGEDAREGSADCTYEIERGVAFVHIIWKF